MKTNRGTTLIEVMVASTVLLLMVTMTSNALVSYGRAYHQYTDKSLQVRQAAKILHGNLEGMSRLRVGEHRMVFRHHEGRIEVFFAAPRSVVYEFLAAHLRDLLD